VGWCRIPGTPRPIDCGVARAATTSLLSLSACRTRATTNNSSGNGNDDLQITSRRLTTTYEPYVWKSGNYTLSLRLRSERHKWHYHHVWIFNYCFPLRGCFPAGSGLRAWLFGQRFWCYRLCLAGLLCCWCVFFCCSYVSLLGGCTTYSGMPNHHVWQWYSRFFPFHYGSAELRAGSWNDNCQKKCHDGTTFVTGSYTKFAITVERAATGLIGDCKHF